MVFLPFRTALIHSIIGWVFVISFLNVAALGQPVGSLNGSIPSMFWTIGIPYFNNTDGGQENSGWAMYLVFVVAVFMLVPLMLVNLLFFGLLWIHSLISPENLLVLHDENFAP